MDKIHKSIKSLLLLASTISLANETLHFWVGGGYNFASQEVSIASSVLPYEISRSIPLKEIPCSLNESSPFLSIEIEKDFSTSVSASIKSILHPQIKSFLPISEHYSNVLLEAYGKYHHNEFTYLLGYSLKEDHFNFVSEDGLTVFKNDTIQTALSFGAEMALNDYSRASVSTMAVTSPSNYKKDNLPIDLELYWNVRVGLSYSLKNI